MTHPESVQFGPVTPGPLLFGSQRWSWTPLRMRVADAKRVADWSCVVLRWDAKSDGDHLRLVEDNER